MKYNWFDIAIDNRTKWERTCPLGELPDALINQFINAFFMSSTPPFGSVSYMANGSLKQIGRVAIINCAIENCVHRNRVFRARPNQELVMPEYLNVYLNSLSGQEEALKRSRTMSGLPTLRVGKVKKIEAIIPSLGIQKPLVKETSLFWSRTDQLQTTQVDCSLERESWLPACTNRAFRGDLLA
jgi:hypothetical protein